MDDLGKHPWLSLTFLENVGGYCCAENVNS